MLSEKRNFEPFVDSEDNIIKITSDQILQIELGKEGGVGKVGPISNKISTLVTSSF